MRALPQQRSQRAGACGPKPDRAAISGCVGGFKSLCLVDGGTHNKQPPKSDSKLLHHLNCTLGRTSRVTAHSQRHKVPILTTTACLRAEREYIPLLLQPSTKCSFTSSFNCLHSILQKQANVPVVIFSKGRLYSQHYISTFFFPEAHDEKQKLLSFLFPIGGPNNNNSAVSHYSVKLGTLFCSVSQSVTRIRNKW